MRRLLGYVAQEVALDKILTGRELLQLQGDLYHLRPADRDGRIVELIGLLAMAGDLLSSFIKRRLGRPSSSMMLGLDQVPEALLPLLAVREAFALDAPAIVVTVIAFLLLDLLLSQLLYRLGIRQRPY